MGKSTINDLNHQAASSFPATQPSFEMDPNSSTFRLPDYLRTSTSAALHAEGLGTQPKLIKNKFILGNFGEKVFEFHGNFGGPKSIKKFYLGNWRTAFGSSMISHPCWVRS